MTDHDCPGTSATDIERYEHIASLIHALTHDIADTVLDIVVSSHPSYSPEDFVRAILAARLDEYMSVKAAAAAQYPHINVESFESACLDTFVKGIEERGIPVPACYLNHR